jgi:hypothetical protein
LMPTHIRSRMSIAELETAELERGFRFAKGAPLLKIDALKDARRIPNVDGRVFENLGTRLYDTHDDPQQARPIRDAAIEARLTAGMVAVLAEHECPEEVYERLGLKRPGGTAATSSRSTQRANQGELS